VLLDFVDQDLIKLKPVAQAHEKHHADIARLMRRPVLADHQTFDDFIELFDLTLVAQQLEFAAQKGGGADSSATIQPP